MAKINYDKLSIKELQDVLQKAELQIENRKKTELKTVRKQVKELIKKHGYKPSEIFPSLNANKPKTKVPPKYCNPKNAEQTWTGRGRKPNWVIDFLESGENKLESIEIR